MPCFYPGKYFHICFLLVITAKVVSGQCTVKGKVTDSVNAPFPFAAVGLLNAKDSSVIKGELCNDSGEYNFSNVRAGAYLVKVQTTGYSVQYSQPFKAGNNELITVPDFHIKIEGRSLNSIKVVADKPFMERQADKTIYNVENSVIAAGKDALELLNELPGVSTNDNGNISVLGKPGVLVFVNGKPIHTNVADFLKGIDANQIEKIEVITNPSAKYEAEGNAVINIVLKRNKNMGLNGELTTTPTQGFYLALRENLNLDYRTKKWNFSLNCSEHLFHRYFTHEVIKTLSSANGTPEIFDENAPWTIHGSYTYGSIGIDYMPDKKQTFSLSSDFEIQYEKLNTYANTLIHTPYTAVDSSLYTQNIRDFRVLHAIPSFTYKFKPDTSEKELTVQLIYESIKQTDNQQNPVNYYNSYGLELRPSALNNSSQVIDYNAWLFQTDYTQPITSKIKLDIGLLDQYSIPRNNAQFWNIINDVPYIDTTKTNQFNFTQNIAAGYITYSQKLNQKIDFQVGLRAEQTNDKGVQYVHDTTFTRSYFNLFPSASFNWKASVSHTFSLSYTRRINRPDLTDLNPFIVVIDPYTYSVGNPTLLPCISDHYEFDYIFKHYFTIAISHDYYNKVIKHLSYQDESTHITYDKQVNMDYYTGYNAMLNVGVPIFKWWNTVTSITVYYDNYIDEPEGQKVSIINYSYMIKTLNTFTWRHNWMAELNFLYNSSDLEGLTLTQPVNNLEAGIGKRFFNDKLIIKISASDILRGFTLKNSTVYPGINIQDKSYYDKQTLSIALIWKFGKSQYHREETNKPYLLKGARG